MSSATGRSINRGVAPVTYGQGARPPRGDYGRARADYTCEQDFGRYTADDHDTYRRLYARQLAQLPGLACEEFVCAVQQLGAPHRIPAFDAISARLERATGWQIVGVPGLIPEEAFFSLLASRRFPVTDWIRRPEEFDYVVEPDKFATLPLVEPVYPLTNGLSSKALAKLVRQGPDLDAPIPVFGGADPEPGRAGGAPVRETPKAEWPAAPGGIPASGAR